MTKQNTLSQVLATWDGRHTAPWKELSAQMTHESSFIPQLLASLKENPTWHVPITWLLKNQVEKGKELSPSDWSYLLNEAQLFEAWEARLHVLQLIPKLGLTARDAERFEAWIYRSLEAKNTFERATAFAAYHMVVQQIPGLKQEFLAVCRDALDRERASVKVCIRRVLVAEGIAPPGHQARS